MLAFIVVAALLLDRVVGEPQRGHPLVGFGNCACALEKRFNQYSLEKKSIIIGALCSIVLVVPVALIVAGLKIWLSDHWGNYSVLFDVLVLYWAIGLRSLHQHIEPIQATLQVPQPDSEYARELVARVVSRDTAQMDTVQITTAAVETTIENGADSLFSALFWFAIGGVAMVVAYRLVNTLDAMWGYRSERYEYFGKAAAKLDDLLNYVPARLTALSYGLCGDLKGALRSWRRDAHLLESPNAGVVMTAGAGALNLQLGGDACYHGLAKAKPTFGGSKSPNPNDISRALRLVDKSAVLWCAVFVIASLIYFYYLP